MTINIDYHNDYLSLISYTLGLVRWDQTVINFNLSYWSQSARGGSRKKPKRFDAVFLAKLAMNQVFVHQINVTQTLDIGMYSLFLLSWHHKYL